MSDKTNPGAGDKTPSDIDIHKLSDEQLAGLHQDATLQSTLFDLAKQSINERSQLSGEPTDKNHVYLELNRIMSLNNYKPADLGGKQQISDKDLPLSWNNVRSHQTFHLYEKGDTSTPGGAEGLKDKLKKQIEDETSTVPVALGEGYYQVWARMHPELPAEKVNQDAHRIKHINGDRDVLKVGERLATATAEEREQELQRRLHLAQPKETPAPGAPGTNPGSDKNTPTKPKQADGTSPDPHKNDKPQEPAKHQPPEPPASTPKAETKPNNTPDYNAIYQNLLNAHNQASRTASYNEKSQGFIGKAFDAAKNNIGSSGEGHAWYDPRRAWSSVFDSDLGSNAINRKIQEEKANLDKLKQAADSKDATHFAQIYKQLTGRDFDAADQSNIAATAGLGSKQAATKYDQSQHNGVDAITDVGVAVAVAATLRSGKAGMAETLIKAMGTGAVVGGISKAGLMQMDGRYANLSHDLAVGSLMGATVPIGELGGSQLSKMLGKQLGMTVTGDLLTAKIETQGASFGTRLISAAAKSGTSGGIFGAIESPGRVAINDVEQGHELSVQQLATASLKGSVLGFIGGTALGGSMDGLTDGFRTLRPGSITNIKQTINGVEVPSSGGVGLDQAAAILKIKPEDLAREASESPYSAVDKVVKLYEKTGLNIKKVDALSGDELLPKPFHEALTTVQNVDLLTADSATKLSGKVRVVEATDQFIKANPEAVSEPVARVTADPVYKDVVKLKIETDGQPAADAFEQKFQQGLASDLKTSMAVQQVKEAGLKPEDALKSSQDQVEAVYKQKAADYFKDMTDPAQKQRLNDLVEDIYTKFNPETLSKNDIEGLLSAVPAQDRELAVALLHQSAGTSSDTMLRTRLQSLRGEISQAVGTSSPDNVYTLAPDSSANLLGYLYRKSNSLSMDMNNIDALAADVKGGHIPKSVVLFDDLSSTAISEANRELLQKIPNVYVVDVGAFEKSINIIDLSKGTQAVAAKLDSLLAQARVVRANNPGMLATGVARETLQQGVDVAAKSLGDNVTVIRPNANLPGGAAANQDGLAFMNDVDDLHAQYNVPKASREQIASFLSGYVGEERELAARMLAEGAVHNSFPVMVKKAVDLHNKLSDALAGNGMKMSDLMIVSDKDPGGSSHLVSYLFGKANGISPENFVSSKRLNQMISSGNVKDKAIAYFDDTIYSGSQTTSMLNGNISGLMPFKKVVIASLGAYEKGVSKIQGTHLGSLGKVEVASSSMHTPFYSQAHPFYSQLGSNQQWLVKSIGGSEGFGDIQGSLIWSYMYPDNNLTFFGSKFSGSVLKLPGP